MYTPKELEARHEAEIRFRDEQIQYRNALIEFLSGIAGVAIVLAFAIYGFSTTGGF